jgi:predicted DNA-binding transcriptional regulator YafY
MRKGEYPDDWEERRNSILERDGYQCQQCDASGSDTILQVHHNTPISEGGSHKPSNLQTICRDCHAKEHPTRIKLETAITEQRRIEMKYSSSSGTRVRELDPYGLDMHEGILYLVGHDHYRDAIRIFRPKRIRWAEILSQTFDKPEHWDTKEYLISDMGYTRTPSKSSSIQTTPSDGILKRLKELLFSD